MKKSLTHSDVAEVVRYDASTGKLFWLERGSHLCKTEAATKRWNKQFAGTEALATPDGKGYLSGRIFWQRHLSHRVVWLLCTGEWPSGVIDHIDGDSYNNRFANLRDVPQAINTRNQRISSRNTSGITGVVWKPLRRKWQAQMRFADKYLFLGHFDRIEDAAAARKAADRKYGFHPNHGRAE